MTALNSVIPAFSGWEITVPVNRIGAGSYIDGVWAEGSTSSFNMNAVVQNATAREIELFPENIRSEETIKIHSTTKLQGTNEIEANNSDVIEYNGDRWRVFSVADRSIIGGYYKSFAVRLEE